MTVSQLTALERIVYNPLQGLPDGFFKITPHVYKNISFAPEDSEHVTEALFKLKSKDHDIVIYTDHLTMRLVGIFPHNHEQCYFGYWESFNNLHLNNIAFNMLSQDASLFKKSKICGPMNFNTFHKYRLRLGKTPSWNMFNREPVNPAYYPELLEKLGYTISNTYESRRIHKAEIHKFYENKGAFTAAIEKIPYKIIPLNASNWQRYEQELYELIDIVFRENTGYRTISIEEFKLLYNIDFAKSLCPHTSSLFLDEAVNKLIGVMMCLPNYSSLQANKEGITFKKDYPKLEHRSLLAKSSGIHPDYRKQNLMNFSGGYTMRSFRELYDDVIFCTMKCGNHSIHFTDGIPCETVYYALYEKELVGL